MNRFKQIRESNNIKQADMANMMSVSQGTLSNWERGVHDPDNKSLQKMADIFDCTVDYLLGRVSRPHAHKSVKIPVLGYVHAGVPIEAIEEILDYEEITPELAATGEFFALRIEGDCMEPKISEGDVVIVRKESVVDSGDTAVVIVNGNDAIVRRLIIKDTGIALMATNPGYEPMFFTSDEVNNLPVTILGKVIELRAKF